MKVQTSGKTDARYTAKDKIPPLRSLLSAILPNLERSKNQTLIK